MPHKAYHDLCKGYHRNVSAVKSCEERTGHWVWKDGKRVLQRRG